MKCTVAFDGGNGAFGTVGELKFFDGGFRLDYFLDGDECSIEYADGKLVQRREGALNLKMVFSAGKITRCEIIDGGMRGEFKVFTESLIVSTTQTSVNVELGYLLSEDMTKLQISANAVN